MAIKAFEIDYGVKYHKVVAKLIDELDVLREFDIVPPNTGFIGAPT